jgi:uncharacterized SAM-binding protein YcdF (DUF218 family)
MKISKEKHSMFLIKKIVAPCFFPLSLGLGLLCLGIGLLWGTRRQRAGKICVTLGTGLLVLLSYYPVPHWLLRPLEHHYAHLRTVNFLAPTSRAIKWIVVLGGGEGGVPTRVLEGVRLYRQIPGVKLLLSGGPVFGSEAGALAMARVAHIMGIMPPDLVLEAESRDTEEQARQVKALVGQDPLILVTSAVHMPRAMLLFRKVGLEPLAAPERPMVGDEVHLSPALFFPSPGNLVLAETAMHEYLGLTWAWLRGVI